MTSVAFDLELVPRGIDVPRGSDVAHDLSRVPRPTGIDVPRGIDVDFELGGGLSDRRDPWGAADRRAGGLPIVSSSNESFRRCPEKVSSGGVGDCRKILRWL